VKRSSLEIFHKKNNEDIPELIEVLGSVATSWSSSQSADILMSSWTKGLLSKVKR
jgi:hypothetical protein